MRSDDKALATTEATRRGRPLLVLIERSTRRKVSSGVKGARAPAMATSDQNNSAATHARQDKVWHWAGGGGSVVTACDHGLSRSWE